MFTITLDKSSNISSLIKVAILRSHDSYSLETLIGWWHYDCKVIL